MENKNYLKNEMLFNENILDIDYDYCFEPLTVGIIINNKDGKRKYNVYINDSRGNLDWIETKDGLNEALLFAREMYKGMISYYQGMVNNYSKELIK